MLYVVKQRNSYKGSPEVNMVSAMGYATCSIYIFVYEAKVEVDDHLSSRHIPSTIDAMYPRTIAERDVMYP